MKKLFLVIVFASGLLFTGCEEEEIVQNSLLEKSWTHSIEERITDGLEIYRPSGYMEFPFSWYRQVFIFRNNGLCEYLVLAANDGHYFERGSWQYSEKSNMFKIFDGNSELIYEFEVVELKEDLLKLKPKT